MPRKPKALAAESAYARHEFIAPHPASVEEFLAQQQKQDLLRFLTCGSVDDGKSTLIGRLLWESHQLFGHLSVARNELLDQHRVHSPQLRTRCSRLQPAQRR